MALSAEMMELLNRKKAQIAARAGGDKAAKLVDGKNRLRVLPAAGGGQWWRDFGQHWIKDETGKVLAVIGCTEVAFDQPCDVCDAASRAARGASDDDTLKLIAEVKRVPRRVLVNAQHKLSKNPDEALITELPQSVFKSMLDTILTYADEFGDVLDVNSGLDFIIEKTGKGLDTEYSVMVAPKPSAVANAAAVMANLPDLDAYVQREGQFTVNKGKAINAIAHISGTIPMISGPASSGALTSSRPALTARPAVIEGTSAALDDEIPFDTGAGTFDTRLGTITTISAPAPAPAAPVAVAPAPAPVATPAAPVPAQPAPAAAADDDIEATLKELDALIV